MLLTQLSGVAHSASTPLKRLDQLPYQQRIEVADGAQLVLVDLQSAQRYVVRGPGQFVLARDGVQQAGGRGNVQRQALPAAYRGLAIDAGQATHAGAVLRASATPGTEGWPPFAADQDDERIATTGATLHWPQRPHKGAWQVRLSTADGALLHQASVMPNQIALPPTLTLAPEQDYRLELEWRAPGGMLQSNVLRLRTLSASQTQQLHALAPRAGAPATERLLYALWLRSLGARSLAQEYACLLQQEDC